MSLFRKEVIDAKQRPLAGEILLARPLSFTFLTLCACVLIVVVVVFFFFAEYTRKERLTGRVVLSQGLVKIYSPVVGTVAERFVVEGQSVKKGTPLFTISVERNSSMGNTQRAIGREFDRKRESLAVQLSTQKRVFEEEQTSLKKKLADLQGILAQAQEESAIQEKRLALNEVSLTRFRELARDKYVSMAQLSEREQEYLDQKSRLQVLRRAEANTRAEISLTASALRNAPLNARNQLANIEREISSVAQESYENEARRQITILAPQDGNVTGILANIGQNMSPSMIMLSLIPDGATFEVSLFAPSRAIGFIQGGERVQLRYEAFPYQKFGQYGGVIKDIARSALSSAELQVENQPLFSLYRVTVALDSQSVTAFGQQVTLQEGMQLEADVLLERRKLYEWILEPLYSLTGKI